MATHISVRLFWHDSGWNGAICRDPAANVWCEAHDHVRSHKSPKELEEEVRGKPPTTAGVQPGCEMSLQAFARRRNEIRVWPPEWMSAAGVNPMDIPMGKYSAGLWPYENMWTEDGGARPNDQRRATAESFFEQIEEGKSLVFFYVDERNPLFVEDGERSAHRVLVGISRLETYEKDIREWNETTWNGEVNMVWSVPFRHGYPDDGIRLPVQAIERAVADLERRASYLVPLDGGLRTDFRYGSSRVTLDRAVAVVERAIAALARLQADAVIETSFETELQWLNAVLLELWEDRGPYPGIAGLLSTLGCTRATEIGMALAAAAADGQDAATVLFEALDGDLDPALGQFSEELADAADEWDYRDAQTQQLARLLIRMELTNDQMEVILGSAETRLRHGLPAASAEIASNPYVLCESFVPKQDREPISFVTVDHGLVPHESMAALGDARVGKRDPRRLRALLTEELRDRAADGHTFVAAREALAGAEHRSPEDRPCDVPLERLSHEKVRPTLDETVEQFEIDDECYLSLRAIRAAEIEIERTLGELAMRPREQLQAIDWQSISDELAGESADARVELSVEQRAALDRSLRSPLSIITGSAGTGKSTLLAPLIAAVRRSEGILPILALTPTGKAADRLKGIGVDAMTIHRALASAGWYDRELDVWVEGDSRVTASTLIIDECSMVDVELLATLFRAVDWQALRRLVFVGDHSQLPPIGPGRPFFDVIAVMQSADDGHEPVPGYRDALSALTHNYRVDSGSYAIGFANSFAQNAEPDDANVWAAMAEGRDLGDLRIRYWEDPADLHHKLLAEVHALVDRECKRAGVDLEDSWAFNATIGHHPDAPYGPSHWQILAPMRGGPSGTRKLNALIQERYHGWSKQASRWPGGAYRRWPVKFGDEQITAFDKVMQVCNERLSFWRPGVPKGTNYKNDKRPVFNGQIGIVRGEWPRATQKVRGASEKGQVKRISVEFEGLPGLRFDYGKEGRHSVARHLELAYAVTVHKGQGSQFRHVIFVVPQEAADYFGRELTYTGLTRAQDTLTLFVERDIGPLLALRKRAAAKTPQRNSRLFAAQVGSLSYRAGRLVFGTVRGDRVASKSEVIIADLLHSYEVKGELSYTYEEELFAPTGGKRDFRLPDFTVKVKGRTFYWEHCGMMDDPVYRERWERVRLPWYKRHGYVDRLIVTMDGPNEPIDSGRLEREIVCGRLLNPPHAR
jgi:exodeoxyribonuclease V alpha subunit